MTFACRLTVRLPNGRRVGEAETTTEFEYQGRPVTLRAIGEAAIVDASWLAFTGTGFDTQEGASAFGRQLKGHLRLVGARQLFSIDVGAETYVAHRGGQPESAEGGGPRVHPTVHGLYVYEQGEEDLFAFGQANAFVSQTPTQLFEEALNAVTPLTPPPDGSSLALACDLLSLADFDQTGRARFVTLVTALEAVATDSLPIAEPLRGFVDQCMKELASLDLSGLDASAANSFRGRLQGLAQESINRRVQDVVTRHAPGGEDDEPNARFIRRCYDARSKLVHGEPEPEGLPAMQSRLRRVVSQVLLSLAGEHISSGNTTTPPPSERTR